MLPIIEINDKLKTSNNLSAITGIMNFDLLDLLIVIALEKSPLFAGSIKLAE